MNKPDNTLTTPQATQGVGKEATLYTQRFSSLQDRTRQATWSVLCKSFFQKFVSPNATVVDVGAGDGLFITNINASRKIAVDLSSHVKELSHFGIETIQAPATELSKVISEPVDVVFMSNFLEHLPNKALMLQVLEECAKILKPSGQLLVLQPNIRYVGAAYWDYIDHHIALTESSLKEALEITGFKVSLCLPRFLPYTAKSGLGRIATMIGSGRLTYLYLKIPFIWRLCGGQTFIAASVLAKNKKE